MFGKLDKGLCSLFQANAFQEILSIDGLTAAKSIYSQCTISRHPKTSENLWFSDIFRRI